MDRCNLTLIFFRVLCRGVLQCRGHYTLHRRDEHCLDTGPGGADKKGQSHSTLLCWANWYHCLCFVFITGLGFVRAWNLVQLWRMGFQCLWWGYFVFSWDQEGAVNCTRCTTELKIRYINILAWHYCTSPDQQVYLPEQSWPKQNNTMHCQGALAINTSTWTGSRRRSIHTQKLPVPVPSAPLLSPWRWGQLPSSQAVPVQISEWSWEGSGQLTRTHRHTQGRASWHIPRPSAW